MTLYGTIKNRLISGWFPWLDGSPELPPSHCRDFIAPSPTSRPRPVLAVDAASPIRFGSGFCEEAKRVGEEFLQATTLVLAAGLDRCPRWWDWEEEQQRETEFLWG